MSALLLMLSQVSVPVALSNAIETWVPGELVQQILQDSHLRPYLHLEIPERQPLLVCKTLVGPDFDPAHLEFRIRLVPHAGKDERVFQFTRVEFDDKHAVVDVLYKLEGLRGSFVFTKQHATWELKSRKLWEK
jgi:hypothetical protein